MRDPRKPLPLTAEDRRFLVNLLTAYPLSEVLDGLAVAAEAKAEKFGGAAREAWEARQKILEELQHAAAKAGTGGL